MTVSGGVFALILFFELLFFALLAKKLHQNFYTVFYHLTGSEDIAARLFAFLFLPGTFVHELSHFLMAKVLLVHASNLELIPVLHDDGLKLGSVSIAKTDPFRRLLIGAAPFIFGLSLMTGSLFWLYQNREFTFSLPWWGIGILLFVYFEIGNTMFSSKKDMEGALAVALFTLLIPAVLFFLGINEPFLFLLRLINQNGEIFLNGIFLMGVPVAINLLVLTFVQLFKLRR